MDALNDLKKFNLGILRNFYEFILLWTEMDWNDWNQIYARNGEDSFMTNGNHTLAKL